MKIREKWLCANFKENKIKKSQNFKAFFSNYISLSAA
jgi:hypothetical protein